MRPCFTGIGGFLLVIGHGLLLGHVGIRLSVGAGHGLAAIGYGLGAHRNQCLAPGGFTGAVSAQPIFDQVLLRAVELTS